jgi:DNA repair photolyase
VAAWVFTSLHPASGEKMSVDSILDAYVRDAGAPWLLPEERDIIRKRIVEAAFKFWGIAANTQCPSHDDMVLVGISFRPVERIAGKRVLFVPSNTTINVNSAFNDKGGLSTVGVANCGNACVISCTYCSSGPVMHRNPQSKVLEVLGVNHEDVVIRRLDAVETARRQLTNPDGSPRYRTAGDNRIVEIASLVESLPNKELAEETFRLVNLILALTNWRIRILTKSALLREFARRFTEAERQRLLLGFSIGIPDDDVARVVEKGATLPSTRFKIHRELLDEGFTMYGMSCPVLPVPDFRALAERIADEIQPDRLERVWCEVINRRGDSFIRTIAALRAAGLDDQAHRLAEMNRSEILWELEYNRRAFLGFREVMPAGKLAFLSYTTPSSESWWSQYATDGAVLL